MKKRLAMIFLGVGFLISIALSTAARNLDYSSTLSLWSAALRVDPGNPRAMLGVGVSLLEAGRYPEAAFYLENSIRHAHAGRNTAPPALLNLGILQYRTGREDEALQTFRTLVRSDPDYAQALFNLAMIQAEASSPGQPGWEEALMALKRLRTLLPLKSPRLRQLEEILLGG